MDSARYRYNDDMNLPRVYIERAAFEEGEEESVVNFFSSNFFKEAEAIPQNPSVYLREKKIDRWDETEEAISFENVWGHLDEDKETFIAESELKAKLERISIEEKNNKINHNINQILNRWKLTSSSVFKEQKPPVTIKEIREFLRNSPALMDFIFRNFLHYRIDSSYVERGIGPQIKRNAAGEINLYFPFNSGSSQNPQMTWIEGDKISLKEGEIKEWTFGPFGFEKYRENDFKVLNPIKIEKRFEGEVGSPRIELVSSHPVTNVNPLASFGHSWIRFKLPLLGDKGEDTGLDWVYSVGYQLHITNPTINTPDIHEFLERAKIYLSVPIDVSKFKEIKTLIEDIQACRRGEEIDNPRAKELSRSIESGTCANFATYLYNLAVPESYHVHDPRPGLLKSIFSASTVNYINSLTKPFEAIPLVERGVKIVHFMLGINMPSEVISEQERLNKLMEKQSLINKEEQKSKAHLTESVDGKTLMTIREKYHPGTDSEGRQFF